MCGDLEEEGGPSSLEELMCNRFILNVRSVLAEAERHPKKQPDAVFASLDKLFTDALSRALKDMQAQNPNDHYRILALLPLVFARLAGFMAAHASPQDDPLRKVMEALMHGYAEPESITPDHGHDHDDAQGHQHY
jgi:hypothetical protein